MSIFPSDSEVYETDEVKRVYELRRKALVHFLMVHLPDPSQEDWSYVEILKRVQMIVGEELKTLQRYIRNLE